MSSAKFQFKKKPLANGAEVPKVVPVKNAKDGMRAVLGIVMNHTAEILNGVVEAIAAKYGLDKEEMLASVAEHPAVTGVVLNPALNDLGFLFEEEVTQPAPTDAASTGSGSTGKKKRFVIKKKPDEAAA